MLEVDVEGKVSLDKQEADVDGQVSLDKRCHAEDYHCGDGKGDTAPLVRAE